MAHDWFLSGQILCQMFKERGNRQKLMYRCKLNTFLAFDDKVSPPPLFIFFPSKCYSTRYFQEKNTVWYSISYIRHMSINQRQIRSLEDTTSNIKRSKP